QATKSRKQLLFALSKVETLIQEIDDVVDAKLPTPRLITVEADQNDDVIFSLNLEDIYHPFISSLRKDSVIDRAGLKVGDRIY
ncbi:hypothetical protein PFISCL1PPCAC_27761, partial [Pristionchus fissidentatus]